MIMLSIVEVTVLRKSPDSHRDIYWRFLTINNMAIYLYERNFL